jgi:hypothetical protein
LSITSTVLTFVGVPAAIMAVIAGLAYAGPTRRGKRYRPGRPFDFAPVWFLSAPEQLAGSGDAELTAGPHREALTGQAATSGTSGETASVAQGVTGGASDHW